ncbi:hypothetical protein [Desulfoluna spongiiphila]|uniref:Uncharacterized protein n=1 Tax=Desulfoluna spongiiphila TaxID=419481 RepID=A0A1G5DDN2_9BACT|nr:hypothetical protein [Desulfoluna spongiiphila]SCY12520.1 hypothetical protein SAMN05216233_104116 [Desulfoluna spongiiphila]
MKKNNLILALVCSLVVLSGAVAQAQVVAMSDADLAEVTGQAGFATIGNYAGFQRDLATDSLHFGASAAIATLFNASHQGEHTGDVSAIRVAEDGSYSFDIKNPGFTIQNYQTSLRVGNPTGTGNSLGTVSMEYIRVTTQGTVRVTVR